MHIVKPLIIVGTILTLIAGTLFGVYHDKTEPPHFASEAFVGQKMKTALEQIAQATIDGGAPGVVIHVRENGEGQSVSAGVANKATGQPMPTGLPLRIASITKLYTAAVIHSLIEAEHFSLDTAIRDLLPNEILRDIPNADLATVRQLLQHTSGIPDYYDIRSYLFSDWRRPITLERMLPVVRRHDATGAPGAGYAYSNTGYLLLGEIAEHVTGQSMETLIDQVIVAPLGLDATFYNRFQPVEDDVHGYGTYLRPWKDTHEYWEHSGPDGGIMASASDVSIFLEALLLNNGRLNQLGVRMTDDMIERTSRRGQGLGVETIIARSGEEIFGHTGDVFGYQTIAHAYPERGIVVVAQVNCNCSALSASLIANLYRAIETIDGSIGE